jgi:hypothetical protein
MRGLRGALGGDKEHYSVILLNGKKRLIDDGFSGFGWGVGNANSGNGAESDL